MPSVNLKTEVVVVVVCLFVCLFVFFSSGLSSEIYSIQIEGEKCLEARVLF